MLAVAGGAITNDRATLHRPLPAVFSEAQVGLSANSATEDIWSCLRLKQSLGNNSIRKQYVPEELRGLWVFLQSF